MKLETLLCCVAQNALRYLEPFRRGLRVWWTDRQNCR